MQAIQTGRILGPAACVAAVLGLALPVWAQDTTDEAGDRLGRALREGDVTQTRPAGLDRMRQDRDAAATRPSGVTGKPIGPDEEGQPARPGWVRVGFDYDDDGRFDSFDYVPADEADRFRSAGARGMEGDDQQARREEMRRTPLRERAPMRRGMEERRAAEERWRDRGERMTPRRHLRLSERLEGRIVGITPMNVYDQEHLIVHLETADNRRVQVDLGRRDRLSEALSRLEEGNQISVMGRRSLLRDRPLIAHRVQRDGEWIDIDVDFELPGRAERISRDLGGRQYSGELISTREAWFSGHDHAHLLARVRLENQDWTTVVDLGPAEHLSDYNLRLGEQISFMARDGCINGQQALIADELTTPDGQFVQLDNYEAEETLRLGGERFRGQLRGRPVGPGGRFDTDPAERERFWDRSYRRDQYQEREPMRRDQYRNLEPTEPRGSRERFYRDSMREGTEGTRGEDYGTRSGRLDRQNRSRDLSGEREIEIETPRGESEMEFEQ